MIEGISSQTGSNEEKVQISLQFFGGRCQSSRGAEWRMIEEGIWAKKRLQRGTFGPIDG